MCRIISFGNVRMNGMKGPVTSSAALGVGLAIIVTIGLSAIAGVVELPVKEVQQVTEPSVETPKMAPSPEMTGSQGDVSSGESTTGSAPSTSLEPEKFALHITTSTDRSQYKIGETVQVILTLTNISERTFTFKTNPASMFKVLVFDASGSTVGSFPNTKVDPLAPPKFIVLKPGESRSQLLQWNQSLFDLSEGSFRQVDAGIYNLVGELNLFGEKSFQVQLKPARSSPVQITIVP